MWGSRRRGFASALVRFTCLLVLATPAITLAQTQPTAAPNATPAAPGQVPVEVASPAPVGLPSPAPAEHEVEHSASPQFEGNGGPVQDDAPNVTCAAPAESVDVPYSAGHHVFDRHYLFVGINHQRPNGNRDAFHRTVGELEFSWVPRWALSDRLAWAGAWVSGGFHETRDADDTRFRFGAGIQAGYRFIATDIGYVYDRVYGSGVRWRFGPALAVELGIPKYATACCLPKGTSSRLACECDRTIKGISVFPYWAIETYPEGGADGGPVTDGMFGVSLKFAWSL